MSRALADALTETAGSRDRGAGESVPPGQRAALESLARGTGFVSTPPQGRGVIYRIGNRAGLEAHLRTLRLESAATLAHDLPRLAANIATHRESKAARRPVRFTIRYSKP